MLSTRQSGTWLPRVLPVAILAALAGAKPLPYGLPELTGGTNLRPEISTDLHNLSEVWATLSNVGVYGNIWGESNMEWPGGSGSTYLWFGSIWASACGAVTPSGLPGMYVSRFSFNPTVLEFWPSEGHPMERLMPGPVGLEESRWGEDDWYGYNEDPLGVQVLQKAYTWATPGYDLFVVNDISIIHLSEHGNPGIPLDAFCFSICADADIASADPLLDYYRDDMVYYDGHAIWSNDPDATFDYQFDDGGRASEADLFTYQRNPDASWSDPLDDVYYFYNYSGPDGIVDADANSDGVSDHFTVLFRVSDGDTVYSTEPNTGLQLFSRGRPPSYWLHTVDDTTYAVVPRNLSYMWDGDRPSSSTDDTGEPTYVPPCNGFLGWRLLDAWVRRADGSIERPMDVLGCTIPLSHSWWNWEDFYFSGDTTAYEVQWGANPDLSGRRSGPAFLAGWMGDPAAPLAFQPLNPGPFPVVQDNPLCLGYAPFDFQFLLTVGPVDLADGDTLHIVGGWVMGRGLADLRVQADDLLDAYYRDGGWGIPDIPPVPVFFYEAGDGCVELIWSDDAETYQPFGGYRLYRSVFDICDWELVGSIEPGVHAYTDTTVTRGYPYYYALCSYDAQTLVESGKSNFKQALDGTPIPVVPGWSVDADWKETMSVVPNPYRGSAGWELPHQDRIAFTHLPAVCDVCIYDLGGNLVVTLRHRSLGGDDGEEYWDLRNESDQPICSGLYVYCVRTSDDHLIGKFAVIR